VSKSIKKLAVISGAKTDLEAAEAFRVHFSSVCMPNNEQFNASKQDEFNDTIRKYENDNQFEKLFVVTKEIVGLAIAKQDNGKSPGFDNLTTGHLTHCHPQILSLLATLFNLMLSCGIVPYDFGIGITIPIPKDENLCGAQNVEGFRGITLSPVLSKVFEHCLITLFQKYLVTAEKQYAFKSKSGCPHAIYVLRNVIDYYVENDSTVNICCLDITKAFDKVNHYVLFTKLIKRRLTPNAVRLLLFWYSNAYNNVRWGDALSQPYKLHAGVKQGGVLSPALFCCICR